MARAELIISDTLEFVAGVLVLPPRPTVLTA